MEIGDMFLKFFGKKESEDRKIEKEEKTDPQKEIFIEKTEQNEEMLPRERTALFEEEVAKMQAKAQAQKIFFEDNKVKVEISSESNFKNLTSERSTEFIFSNKQSGKKVIFTHICIKEYNKYDPRFRKTDQYFCTRDGKREDISKNKKARNAMDALIRRYVDEESVKVLEDVISHDEGGFLGGEKLKKLGMERRKNIVFQKQKESNNKELIKYMCDNFKGLSK